MTGHQDEVSHQRILLIEPVPESARAACEALQRSLPTAEIVIIPDEPECHRALEMEDFDIVVLDYDLPWARSVEFLQSFELRDKEPKVLLVSRCADAETARGLAAARRPWIVRDERWLQSLKGALRDTLRTRRLEQEMLGLRAQLTEANRMLEERNERLDEFCSTIAHDIRGPLGGLMLKIEYIADAYAGKLDDRCTKLLQGSLQSAERVVGIVQAMYEFAKVGAKTSTFGEVDLHALVLEVLSDLNVGQSREVNVGVAALPCVWGSTGLLRRIFINLISNAIKYNDKDTVQINVGYSGDSNREIGRFAELFVEDNGPGIPLSEMSRIFAMFNRGAGREAGNDGLGVGLAVVQKIIDIHYGRVELAASELGGVRCSFSLPLDPLPIAG